MKSPVSGMLPINKPIGMVSKDVSRQIERCVGRVKLGHVGTLDPMASGVLPLLFGKATRLQDMLLELPKTYEFTVKLGVETDTLDDEGEVVQRQDIQPFLTSDLERILKDSFTGSIEQQPPIYSAVKYKGKPLYYYARKGLIDQVPLNDLKRRVVVEEICLLDASADWIRLRARCSKGTYVRVLAKDIAKTIGNIGTVTQIYRTVAAGISVSQSVSLEQIKSLEDLNQHIIPTEKVSLGVPVWKALDAGWTKRLLRGQKLLVSQLHFAKSVELETFHQESIDSYTSILLADEQGRAFGLGEAKFGSDNCIELLMRKGL